MTRSFAGIAATLLTFLCVGLFATAAKTGDYDRYYKVVMEGSQAGWLHLRQLSEGERITSTREMHFSFSRGQARSSATMKTTFVETAAGKAISMRSEMAIGAKPVVMEYAFGPAEVQIVSDPQGERKVTAAPLPAGDWLTPRAVAQFLRQRLAAGAKEITYKTIDPLSGLELDTVTHSNIQKQTVRIGERTFEGFRMKSSSSRSPGVTGDDFVDLEGTLVTQTAAMGGLMVTTELAGPEVVRHAGEAPELMISTFVKPDRPIVDARRVWKSTFVLDYGDDQAPPLPETGSQTTIHAAGSKVTVRVDATMPYQAPEGDWENPRYRTPSAMVASDDPRVVELAGRAIKDIPADQVHARAEAIRGAVFEHIRKKDLSVGFATASEVVETRQGDCSEHAVLVAAALRAAGIPSRIAAGLIYADQFAGSRDIFGYHMWAQALLQTDTGPAWVDLDATLPPPGYDATHLALIVSALGDNDATQDLLGIAAAMGRLSIKVMEIEHRR